MEYLKLMYLIKDYPRIRFIVEKLQQDSNISLAVIFGSYAKGKPLPDSDVDLFVESDNPLIKDLLQDMVFV
jgi:predicted nucleotidyltransferase